MSSLAASRSDNFYFPPEYDGRIHGGLSKFNNPDYKGSNQYQKSGIVRFELPFDAFCLGCNRHICKGNRFNAKKEKAGKYFSTTIFSFSMKCPSCPQEFIIKTNPKDMTYDFDAGLRKMHQDYEAGAEDGVIQITSEETKKQLEDDAIFRLQYENETLMAAQASKRRISNLLDSNDSTKKHDYELNCLLRKKNRSARLRSKELKIEGERLGLSIPLAEADASDSFKAKEVRFKPKLGGAFVSSERCTMTAIRSQSIFSHERNSGKSSLGTETVKVENKMAAAIQKQAKQMISLGKIVPEEKRNVKGPNITINIHKNSISNDAVSAPKFVDKVPQTGLSLLFSAYECTTDD